FLELAAPGAADRVDVRAQAGEARAHRRAEGREVEIVRDVPLEHAERDAARVEHENRRELEGERPARGPARLGVREEGGRGRRGARGGGGGGGAGGGGGPRGGRGGCGAGRGGGGAGGGGGGGPPGGPPAPAPSARARGRRSRGAPSRSTSAAQAGVRSQ